MKTILNNTINSLLPVGYLVGHAIRIHLWFEIIGCNFRRWNKFAVFAIKLCLLATIEEKRYMSIFFRLCNER